MKIRDEPRPGIVASDLTKSYGSVRAVRGVDLAIAPGETVAVLGPNGAGKSTTLDMLLGLTRPDHGTVTIFGATPATAVRSGWIGGMLQTANLPDRLTVHELVTVVASYYPHPLRVDEVLHETGCEEFARRFTNRLSGGQGQRVRFAAALVGNPDLLVLDEPTSGIDVEGRHNFWRVMRGMAARGKTVVFATHYLEEADVFADRVVLMAHGRIIADGPATAIKARVAARTIRATLPDVDISRLAAVPGVLSAERRGDAITLLCSDADAALAALHATFTGLRNIEVRGSSLEEAFLELTAEQTAAPGAGATVAVENAG